MVGSKTTSFSTLLVTGGAGFIGSCFVLESLSRGARVIVLDKLTYAGPRENLPEAGKSGRMELVEGDIADARLVGRLLTEHSIDAVVNFAAESHVDRSITGPGAFI